MTNKSQFRDACASENTIDDLLDALMEPANSIDCKAWGLSATAYKHAIVDAIRLKISWLKEEISV